MKFRFIVLIIFLLAFPALAAAQKKKSYVGYKYTGVVYNHKLPNGVRDLGGSLLEDEDYGVSRMKKGKTEMLWLTKITSRNRSGIPNWKVKAVLYLPLLKKDQEILRGLTYPCTINEQDDLNLIVLAKFSPKKKAYSVEKAWRANTETNKFEVLSTEDIVCESVDE